MFYVIETEYTGPNADEHLNDHTVEVTTEPGMGNSSGEIILQGWLGTSNDWASYAHGLYSTQSRAESAAQAVLSESGWREVDLVPGDEAAGTVARYQAGEMELYTAAQSAEWAYEDLYLIAANTTDAKIADMVFDCESNSDEMILDLDAIRVMYTERRDELQSGPA